MTVRIRDDMPGRTPGPGSPLTQEQISEVIWGPYRILTGLMNTGSNCGARGQFRLLRNERYPIPLERSFPPLWNPNGWREHYDGEPVRLEVTCRREGQEPWPLTDEVQSKYSLGDYIKAAR